jgi:Protein of unknown function (DUF2782)
MRTLAAVFLAVLAFDAAAQSVARERPPGTMPLDEPPPPPPIVATDPALEPQVTTRTDEQGQTVQEYRVNGRLYMQRITPRNGRPYVLIDDRGDGTFTRQDNTLDRLRVPQWVLLEF